MKSKPKVLEVRINEVKQIVENASGFTSKRLQVVFSNTECRIKDIVGIQQIHIINLEKITSDCMFILDKEGVEASLEQYKLKLNLLIDNIVKDIES